VADHFLDYYNRELSYLRTMGTDFGNRHRDVASRLRMDPDHCDDPHVERLLEGFAFLAARIHLRLDDEFPEITGALLEELYPDLTRPVPPVAMVQLTMDPERGDLTKRKTIPRGTAVTTQPRTGSVCKFQTCYTTDVWPLEIIEAGARPGPSVPPELTRNGATSAGIELRFSPIGGVSLSSLKLERLRLHLTGSPYLVNTLYQLLLTKGPVASNCCHSVALSAGSEAGRREVIWLDPGCLQEVGFDVERDGLCPNPALPYAAQDVPPQFAGYRILEDFFIFPWKYHFLDIAGLSGKIERLPDGPFSVWFLFAPIDVQKQQTALGDVNRDTFRLGCTPIVNLFSDRSGPIRVQHELYEERIPVQPGNEIYSVDGLDGGRKTFGRLIGGSALKSEIQSDAYFTVSRRDNRMAGRPPEYFVSLVSRRGDLLDPGVRVVTAGLTCTNRELLAVSSLGTRIGDLYIRDFPDLQIQCTLSPTAGLMAPSRRTYLWRLLSQLSLNHLSLVERGREALQAILRVHNLADADAVNDNIDGIVGIKSKPAFARVNSQHGTAFVRGKNVEITLNDSKFGGGGMFLFGMILDRFLSTYTSLNSFSQLVLKVGDRQLHSWPPRSGNKIVM
jgi:type VI secretion system protein ImpG